MLSANKDTTKQNNAMADLITRLLFKIVARAIILGLSFYAFSYLLTQMNGGNDLFGEKFKLEIKTAKDITQRLSDVKGVDEIKHEVEDLIKMLKNPE
jgi:ATP-dependent Zn protease